MKANFSSLLRSVRALIFTAICAIFIFANAVPAFAIESYQSQPKEATTQLLETQRLTDEVSRSAPPSLEETQERANKGINEIQGDADADKMKRPENSRTAVSVKDEVQNALEKVTGKK
jgi:cytoskeletal protein RodZ